MRVGEAFPSNYLKASDLHGKRVVVTIDHVTMEEVGRDKDRKPVIYFEGKEKGLVCNVTNARKISSILGTDETDDWQGGSIVLFGTMVEFGGEQVEGIRVAAVPVAPAKGRKIPAPPVEAEMDGDDDPSVPF